MSGAWRASTPSSPSAPLAMMNSTSPSKRLLSTLTTRSGYFTSLRGLLLLHRFALLPRFVDPADHVGSLLRQVAVLAFQDLLESAHRLPDRYRLALAPGEPLGDVAGLREEPLNLASPRHGLLGIVRQLFPATSADDVLQVA